VTPVINATLADISLLDLGRVAGPAARQAHDPQPALASG
jgi:hypothetical protein